MPADPEQPWQPVWQLTPVRDSRPTPAAGPSAQVPHVPFASFGDAIPGPVQFDWARDQPQKVRKNGVDTYVGTIILYSQAEFDALWALRVVVNVTPVGDGTQTIYIDSWQPPATIQHVLMSHSPGWQIDGSGPRETHTAILSEMSMSVRRWGGGGTPTIPTVVALEASVEFLLLS